MRVATFRTGGRERLGVVRDERMVDVALAAERLSRGDLAGATSGMLALIAGGAEALASEAHGGKIRRRSPKKRVFHPRTLEIPPNPGRFCPVQGCAWIMSVRKPRC